jgi:hypothetical protein
MTIRMTWELRKGLTGLTRPAARDRHVMTDWMFRGLAVAESDAKAAKSGK